MESQTGTTFSGTPRTNRRHEMNETHFYDKKSREEVVFCGTETCKIDRITVQNYMESHIDGHPVGIVCEACKVLAVRWIGRYCEELEADACVCLTKAERLRKKDAARYRNSVEEAELEADRLQKSADRYRQVADRLTRETAHLTVPQQTKAKAD